MKIATMTTLCYSARDKVEKTSALEAVRRLHAAGFTYIDLNLCGMVQGHPCSFVQDDWKSEVQELAKEVKRLGVTLHQAHLPYYHISYIYDEENREFNALFDKMMRRAIELCGMLEIPCAVVHNYDLPEGDQKAHIEENLKRFGEYVELANQRGIRIAFENMRNPKRFCSKTEDLIALTEAFAPKNVGICWDFGHGQINYQEDHAKAIARLKDRICAVHIHDNNGKNDQHHPPFIGTVAWEDVLPALRQANYKGYLNYEIGVNKTVPDLLRDEMIRYCFKAGEYLVKMFEGTAQ